MNKLIIIEDKHENDVSIWAGSEGNLYFAYERDLPSFYEQSSSKEKFAMTLLRLIPPVCLPTYSRVPGFGHLLLGIRVEWVGAKCQSNIKAILILGRIGQKGK